MQPLDLFKCLSDETRLTLVTLIHREGELCVCELTHALGLSQPKVSRHLAQLRRCGLLGDRREGQWVYYGLEVSLPGWVMTILDATVEEQEARLVAPLARLAAMGNRPERRLAMC